MGGGKQKANIRIMRKTISTTGGTRVSIQGYEGSFHQVAAEEWFGRDVEVIPCATFRGVARVVHSHSMALLQCIDYLERRPAWKLVETEDTALSAKNLAQHRNRHAAAIAGRRAADLFGLEILAPDIQTMKNNYTRFLILQREAGALVEPNPDKASVNFHTDHSRGSLA